MKRILFFTLLASLFIEIPIAIGGSPSIYQEQALKLTENSKSALIRHGLCIDENDCTKKQFVFFLRTSSGVMLDVYGISDLRVISEIIGACLDEYEKNAKRMSIDVKVYREKHEDVMGLIKPLFVSPYIKLYLQGEK